MVCLQNTAGIATAKVRASRMVPTGLINRPMRSLSHAIAHANGGAQEWFFAKVVQRCQGPNYVDLAR